jgi:hypothetical protein
VEKRRFWTLVVDSRLLSIKNLIIAGDLNLTLSSGETWGGSASAGSLDGFFKALFQNKNLIDIEPGKVVPTWRNGRSGSDAIWKRLDRFLVSEDLLSSVGLYRSWVEYPFVSDHAPMIIQLEISPLFKAYPFKFNSQWLVDQNFTVLVHNLWTDPKFLGESGKQKRMVWKLKDLKSKTKQWAKLRTIKENSHLLKLEKDITNLLQHSLGGLRTLQEDLILKNLEQSRNKYLKEKEELWRQRSRAIWIKSGDQNTKFFHNFANFRRNRKFVWEIRDDLGILHSGQEDLKTEATKYFKSFFREQDPPSTVDQVKVVSLFSRFITENEAVALYHPILLGELKAVLSFFKRDKSPGPDGWTVEFLHSFLRSGRRRPFRNGGRSENQRYYLRWSKFNFLGLNSKSK